MLKIKPLDTILTAFDDPLYVDVEVDSYPTTIEVFLDGQTIPFTQFTMTSNYARVRVFSTNPYGSTPTNRVHGFTFRRVDTGETVRVEVAYIARKTERMEFRKPDGTILVGTLNTVLKMDGKVFYRSDITYSFNPLDLRDHSQVFYEFFHQESTKKYYFVSRGDWLMRRFYPKPDVHLDVVVETLWPADGVIVEVEYDLSKLWGAYTSLLPQMARFAGVVLGFLTRVGPLALPIAMVRFVGKTVGIEEDIVDVRVEDTTVKVRYSVDPPILKFVAMVVAGVVISFIAMKIIEALSNIKVAEYRALTTVEAINATARVKEEMTKAIGEVFSYAQQANLTPEQVQDLLKTVMSQYTTQDIEKALELYKETETLSGKLKEQRLLYALAGAGVGAAIVAILTRGR